MFNNSLIFTINSYLISDKTIIIKTGKSYAEVSVIEKHTGEPPKENHIGKPTIQCIYHISSSIAKHKFSTSCNFKRFYPH